MYTKYFSVPQSIGNDGMFLVNIWCVKCVACIELLQLVLWHKCSRMGLLPLGSVLIFAWTMFVGLHRKTDRGFAPMNAQNPSL